MFKTNLWGALAAPLVAAFSLAATPADAGQVLIVDTGDPPQTNAGYSLLNSRGNPGLQPQAIAARFTVGEDFTITSIMGWVGRFSSGPSTYHITLYADGPNQWIPGQKLYTVGLSDGGPGSGYIGSDSLRWAVTTGAYWVGIEVLETDTLYGFMPYRVPRPLLEAMGPPGAYQRAPGAPGSAFRIAGVVPEPGTWALMILGFGGVGVMLRTRREAVTA